MIRKLVPLDRDEKFEYPIGVDGKEGSHNSLPEPCWEVHRDEYLHFTGIYGPLATDFRQVDWPEIAPYLINVTIHWFHDRGFLMLYPNKWRSAKPEEREAGSYSIVYDEPIRYFRFGCDHDYKQTPTRHRQLYLAKCDKCGASHEVDTS